MNPKYSTALATLVAGLVAGSVLLLPLQAADAKKDVIKDVMKTYHKAPEGQDPVCKKAAEGKATPDQLKQLVAAYESMAKAKPPKGDEASWKEKTAKLVAAAKALQKGEADGAAKYKDAVGCKGCHMAHKPD